MKELVWKYVGTIIRTALVALTTWMVAKGIITQDQADGLVVSALKDIMMVLPGLIAFVWSLIEKYRGQKQVATALALPAGSSLADVKQTIAAGDGVPPTQIKT